MPSTCVICKTVYPSGQVRKYSVPLDPVNHQRWEKICGLQFSEYAKLCEKHFAPSAFSVGVGKKRRRLKSGAVPTLLLPQLTKNGMNDSNAQNTVVEVPAQTYCDTKTEQNNNSTSNEWRIWCRLCAKEESQGNISVFFTDGQTADIAGAADVRFIAAIEQYFLVEIKCDEDLPKMLCTECFSLVTSLINFSERVAKVQQMFCELHNSSLIEVPVMDLHAVRLKYDLLDEKLEHDIIQHQPPEEHYFESKPKIDDLEECTTLGNDNLIVNNSNPLEQQQPLIKIKDNIRPCHSCTDCQRKFKYMHHLRQHMKSHSKGHLSPELRKVEPCPYCGKKSNSHAAMQSHIKYIHMNERRFICEKCGVAKQTIAALNGHMLTHTDYAPFICEICTKGFKDPISLERHMETHDPNKHTCPKCGLQLNSRPSLNHHMLVHSDEMRHKCDSCGRAFKHGKNLKMHLMSHIRLKPYSCDFCDRSFVVSNVCRMHQKKSHPEELAALEIAGGGKTYTTNIPKLETLKALTKAAPNLAPVVSKRRQRF